jgi:hypothetical protein
MGKKYLVTLTEEETATLKELTNKGHGSAQKRQRATALLHCAGNIKTDVEIADATFMHVRTIEELRRRFVEDGLEICLSGKPRAHKLPIMDGENTAKLVQLVCEEREDGIHHWSLRQLSEKFVTIEGEHVSHETIRKTLNNLELKPWQRKEWCIPPEKNAEFVANMEDILKVYKRPQDPNRPLVCMDECPKQLIGEKRVPIPAKPGAPEKYDTEYVRHGTVALFMFNAPHQGWRRVVVTEQRTMLDWAAQVKHLVDVDFPNAEKIVLVCDNLNTHRPAALYEAFPAEEASRIMDRLEIHYTPKHGSWLNMAEIELSVLNRHGLPDRVASFDDMKRHVEAWTIKRNASVKKVIWQFTVEEARIILVRLYPQVTC